MDLGYHPWWFWFWWYSGGYQAANRQQRCKSDDGTASRCVVRRPTIFDWVSWIVDGNRCESTRDRVVIWGEIVLGEPPVHFVTFESSLSASTAHVPLYCTHFSLIPNDCVSKSNTEFTGYRSHTKSLFALDEFSQRVQLKKKLGLRDDSKYKMSAGDGANQKYKRQG